MTDFHIHVLPCMDDGAQSVEESLSMLAQLAAQGVTHVVCTPHFYGEKETLDAFVARRAQSFAALQKAACEYDLELTLGAEIAMWHGMSAGISEKLCPGESNLLLCELPASYAPWVIDELEELGAQGYCPMIAHLDRVQALYTKDQLACVLECHGIAYQLNASAFSRARVRGLARALCAMGETVVLGSDGHGAQYRRPDLASAAKCLRGLGMRAVRERIERCEQQLTHAIF